MGALNGRGPRFIEPAEPAIATPLQARDPALGLSSNGAPRRKVSSILTGMKVLFRAYTSASIFSANLSFERFAENV